MMVWKNVFGKLIQNCKDKIEKVPIMDKATKQTDKVKTLNAGLSKCVAFFLLKTVQSIGR